MNRGLESDLPLNRTAEGKPPGRTMIHPDEALRLVVEAAAPRGPRAVPLEEACGLRLAEEVRADRSYPPFDRAMMDGYAVRVADAGRTLEVAGEIAAGDCPDFHATTPSVVPEMGLSPSEGAADGRCIEIMTGAPCPPQAEAVVPKENARRSGNCVRLPSRILPGQHIAPRGSECAAGSLVLQPQDVVTPLAIAVMASLGWRTVRVMPKPTLGIIVTGAELVPPDAEPELGQIRDSNGPMLAAMARDLGLHPTAILRAEDRLGAIVSAVEASSDRDIVLLTGGVSMGNHDLVPDALRAFGAEIIFHKARQKPGKPLLLARHGNQLLFGLPGNPLACHFCFHRYVTAAIRRMGGTPGVREVLSGELAEAICPKPGRTYFVPASAGLDFQTRSWRVQPMPGISSADVFHSCRANCYLHVPEGRNLIPAGEVLSFSWIAGSSSTY